MLGKPCSSIVSDNRLNDYWLIGSTVSAELTAESLYTKVTLSSKIAPSHGGSGPHLIHDSLGQSEQTLQTASRSVQLFSDRWPQTVRILYNGCPFPPKLPFPIMEIWTPSNTWFLGSIHSENKEFYIELISVLNLVTNTEPFKVQYRTFF